jgi:GNAT superfamily N-acetyltransferase
MTETIRNATKAEVSAMLGWAAAEGWNSGLDDLEPFWRADADGYWVSYVDDKMAATLSLVHHDPAYAFLGLYIAAPEFRGRGIGFRLWQRALSVCSATSVGLDGVVALQANYRKSGFAYAHANWRYGGQLMFDDADAEIVPVGLDLALLACDYDTGFNPAPRPRFMQAWLTDTPSRNSLAAIIDGRMVGLGTIRACQEGFKIGPLFAEDETVADRLFRQLVASVGGGMVYLDIPEPNRAARALCERYGMAPVFETARMYRGAVPVLPMDRIFGITTLELG